jgi:anaerobic dimethyl sulfoxide reductase subunit B (iron-sulfur subunit)
MRVHQYEKGSFPNVRLYIIPVFCYHCENPACIENCPYQAVYKEEKYGAVLIDEVKCSGCRVCWHVCPYGAPQFESDDPAEKARKCTMCIDRLEQGMKPICVMTCPMRALDFGPLDVLQKKYGTNRDLEDMPSSTTTKPAIIFKPLAPKKTIVPYPTEKAITLMATREPLPSIYNTTADLTTIPPDTVGRDRLILKAKNAAELMCQTQDDDG